MESGTRISPLKEGTRTISRKCILSRFNNVTILLKQGTDYNREELYELLLDEDTDSEALAEDIAFVIISLFGMVPKDKWKAFTERLTVEIVNHEIERMNDDA